MGSSGGRWGQRQREDAVLLPWDRFSAWAHCVCVVTFDLELGQALEVVYPSHAQLTEQEKMNVCYLAFPDSNSGCMGDTNFHFRMRRCSGKTLRPSCARYNQRCPLALQADPLYYYGFVYFRQVKDKTVPRGYLQKSVVLLSQLPFISLFSHVVAVVAPEYFDAGEPGLEAGERARLPPLARDWGDGAACHDMDQWAAPQPGAAFALPLVGAVLHCRVPSRFDLPAAARLSTEPTAQTTPAVVSSVYEPQLFADLRPVLGHVQLLWELVLLSEPIAVLATSPTLSASVVQSLTSLIWPLRCGVDYRPFFTIHDSEFREYTSKERAVPNVILGVTNPFFSKTLQRWPHILRLSENASGNDGASPLNRDKLRKTVDVRTLDGKSGVFTQYKPFLAKDKSLLKRLGKGVESGRPFQAQNALLRRYFFELTQSFMIPLERYLASLMPLQRQISPFKSAPQPRQFDFAELLGTLEVSGPALTSGVKGDWTGLYRRFVTGSAHFGCWLQQRRREMAAKLELLHLEVLCAADFSTADLRARHEIELVDLVLKLRDKTTYVEESDETIKSELRAKLRLQLERVMDVLSDDMKSVLLSSERLRSDAAAAAADHSHADSA